MENKNNIPEKPMTLGEIEKNLGHLLRSMQMIQGGVIALYDHVLGYKKLDPNDYHPGGRRKSRESSDEAEDTH